MIIEYHGDYDIDAPLIIHSIIKDDKRLKINEWNYIVCQVDKYHEFIRVNDLNEKLYILAIYSQILLTSSLTIEEKTTNFNYGFSFVRELKLFNSYNFKFWDKILHHLTKNNFKYLLHYFSNLFNEDKLKYSKISDEIEGIVTKLVVKHKHIGYNYVINYRYLTICEEGYVK
jgi:hypothetical protein